MALSHRAGLTDLAPAGIFAIVCHLATFWRRGSWRAAFAEMVRRIERLEPEWTPGQHAAVSARFLPRFLRQHYIN